MFSLEISARIPDPKLFANIFFFAAKFFFSVPLFLLAISKNSLKIAVKLILQKEKIKGTFTK